jgi:hypothetical protein
MYRIEPENRRDKVSRFMLARGVRAGVPVDAEVVHSMICDFCDVYMRDLEARMEAYKKIAEDALALKLPEPIIIPKSKVGE